SALHQPYAAAGIDLGAKIGGGALEVGLQRQRNREADAFQLVVQRDRRVDDRSVLHVEHHAVHARPVRGRPAKPFGDAHRVRSYQRWIEGLTDLRRIDRYVDVEAGVLEPLDDRELAGNVLCNQLPTVNVFSEVVKGAAD